MFRATSGLLLLFILRCGAVFAAEVVLFEDGRQVADYNEKVLKLAPGDELVFSNGTRFAIEGVIAHGNTTLIVDLGGNEILRIPLWRGRFDKGALPNYTALRQELDRTGAMPKVPAVVGLGTTYQDFTAFHKSFLAGASLLQEARVPVVAVDFARSRAGEFAVAERVAIELSFEEFVGEKGKVLDGAVVQRMKTQLESFLVATWRLASIGDFHSGQLAFAGEKRGWVLLDFTRDFSFPTGVADPHVARAGWLQLEKERLQLVDYEIKRARSEGWNEVSELIARYPGRQIGQQYVGSRFVPEVYAEEAGSERSGRANFRKVLLCDLMEAMRGDRALPRTSDSAFFDRPTNGGRNLPQQQQQWQRLDGW